MRKALAAIAAAVALLASATPSSGVTLTVLQDQRAVDTEEPWPFGCGDVEPCSSVGLYEFPTAPGHWVGSSLGATQDSDIGPLGMNGSGDATATYSGYPAWSLFLVEFSLDGPANYSFNGSLRSDLYDFALAGLCTTSTCAAGTALAYDRAGSPTGLTDQSFAHDGALAPGQYWLYVEAYSSGFSTSHFDFTFAVPEPGDLGTALLGLLPLALRRARA